MNTKFISIIILVILIVILSVTLFLISRYSKHNKNESANESDNESAEINEQSNDKININKGNESINERNENRNIVSGDDENINENNIEQRANKLIEENDVPTFNNFEEQMHVPMQIDKSLLDVMEEKPCDIEINTKDLIKNNNKTETKRSIGIFLVRGGNEMLF